MSRRNTPTEGFRAPPLLRPIATVLFFVGVSGWCSLVYQVAWQRSLRLIFGHSQTASVVVVAIFILGLGFGSYFWGNKAERSDEPFRLWGRLELGIALLAGLSPLTLLLTRTVYLGIGGTEALGFWPGLLFRVVLTSLAIGASTFLMGGTINAAVRAVPELGRHRAFAAALIGVNTLGALTGALYANFISLEWLGTRTTLLVAALINAGLAALISGTKPNKKPSTMSAHASDLPARWLLVVSSFSGFMFFGAEAIWFRVMSPLLGGSVYSFGIVLSFVLAGLGAGSLLFGLGMKPKYPHRGWIGISLIAEGIALAVPFVLADEIPLVATLLQNLRVFGFGGLVAAWGLLSALVVLPAAVIAGWQFALFIALAGDHQDGAPSDLGALYLSNSLGAAIGAACFGLVVFPSLGIASAWLVAILILLTVGVGLVTTSPTPRWHLAVGATVVLVAVFAFPGPNALWLHTPIGAGRAPSSFPSQNDAESWKRERQRDILWAKDGRESSVALGHSDGYALLVNGKSDGHCVTDAPTQIMLGLLGPLLHGAPRTAAVVGLGTGSSSGWLAEVPSIERVDSIELEPSVGTIALACRAVNHNVMNHPKVRHIYDDARAFLQSTSTEYDVIASEPSNPYRAGVSGLLTEEFYQSVAARLSSNGVFVQWLQTYEIDGDTLRLIVATLRHVFPQVSIWQSMSSDLLLVARNHPSSIQVKDLRTRLTTDPFRTGLYVAWGAEQLEDVLSRHLARSEFADVIHDNFPLARNTDDHMSTEFRFAKTVGRSHVGTSLIAQLHELSTQGALDKPRVLGRVDWARVQDAYRDVYHYEAKIADWSVSDEAMQTRIEAHNAFRQGRLKTALALWSRQPQPASRRLDRLLFGSGLAAAGDLRFIRWEDENAPRLRTCEQWALQARFAFERNDTNAVRALGRAFRAYRQDPWCHPTVMQQSLKLAVAISKQSERFATRLYRALGMPFAAHMLHRQRRSTQRQVLEGAPESKACVTYFEMDEPRVPWSRSYLVHRARCYRDNGHPRQREADDDVARFIQGELSPL